MWILRVFWWVIRMVARGLRGLLRFAWRQIRQAGRNLARTARDAAFGNWWRTLATAAIAGFVVVAYWPHSEAAQCVAGLFTIAIMLFGLRVMVAGVWPMGGGGRRRRRRRND
jgi:hypothetical protein